MWSNWRIVNGVAIALFGIAAAIAGYLVVIAALNSTFFPLRVVRVVGELERVSGEAIRTSLVDRVSGNFFAANLDAVRRAVEQVPWVRAVAVRRQWPDRIVVRVEEHVPVARWSDRRLVNSHGELFAGETTDLLPQLAGPPGAEREVASRYAAFSALIAPLGSPVAELTLSPRYAWQLKLADGTSLEVGRDQARDTAEARLARFVSMFPQVAARLDGRVGHVDLRYPNGFAVRVPGLAEESGARERAKSAARRKQRE